MCNNNIVLRTIPAEPLVGFIKTYILYNIYIHYKVPTRILHAYIMDDTARQTYGQNGTVENSCDNVYNIYIYIYIPHSRLYIYFRVSFVPGTYNESTLYATRPVTSHIVGDKQPHRLRCRCWGICPRGQSRGMCVYI